MKDGAERTHSPINIQPESRSRDGGAFTVARAVKLARAVTLVVFVALGLLYFAEKGLSQSDRDRGRREQDRKETGFDARISSNAQQLLEEGRQIFRKVQQAEGD